MNDRRVGLGLYVGRRRAVSGGYRRLLVASSAGSVVGVAVGWLLLLLVFGVGSFEDALGWVLLAGTFLQSEVSFVVIVGAFAGAALAHFRAQETEPE